MIVEIKRTDAGWDECPIEGATHSEMWCKSYCNRKTLEDVRKHPHVAAWFFREGTRNHREEGGQTVMERLEAVWTIDIPSLEWAVETWGRLVVSESDFVDLGLCVEIYDGYRE